MDLTDMVEAGVAAAVDSKGNIYVAGHTFGNFPGFEDLNLEGNKADSILVKVKP